MHPPCIPLLLLVLKKKFVLDKKLYKGALYEGGAGYSQKPRRGWQRTYVDCMHPTLLYPPRPRPRLAAAAQQQLAQECARRPLDRPRSGASPSPLIPICPRCRAAPAAPYRFPGFFPAPRPRCARTQKSPRSAGFGVLGFGRSGIRARLLDLFAGFIRADRGQKLRADDPGNSLRFHEGFAFLTLGGFLEVRIKLRQHGRLHPGEDVVRADL